MTTSLHHSLICTKFILFTYDLTSTLSIVPPEFNDYRVVLSQAHCILLPLFIYTHPYSGDHAPLEYIAVHSIVLYIKHTLSYSGYLSILLYASRGGAYYNPIIDYGRGTDSLGGSGNPPNQE